MYICCLCIIGVENILHLENNFTESITQYLGQEHVNCWKRSLNAKQISWSSYYTATIILWQQDLPRSQSHFWVKIQLTSKKPQSSTFPFPKLDHQKLPPFRGKNALCANPQISTILNHVIPTVLPLPTYAIFLRIRDLLIEVNFVKLRMANENCLSWQHCTYPSFFGEYNYFVWLYHNFQELTLIPCITLVFKTG